MPTTLGIDYRSIHVYDTDATLRRVDTAGMNEDLLEYVRSEFAIEDDAMTVSAGPRGAMGQIWRLDVGSARYALKEIFPNDDPMSAALVAAEVEFARLAAAGGVRLPASHPDRHGRYLVPAPAGAGWLRLYDWVDLHAIDLSDASAPHRLGVLLAQLHRCAPRSDREPGGEAPDGWYDTPPPLEVWAPLAATAHTHGAGWASRFAELLGGVPALTALVTKADPGAMLLCHRDLHPENVLADTAGDMVVVDWDNLGPAEPGRELARAMFDWFYDGGAADLDAMRRTYEAYTQAGGPGRVTTAADFSMLIASRLNFLRGQVGVAIDPEAEPRHRDWAEREIEEALRILPTPGLVAEVLAVTTQDGVVTSRGA